MPLPIAGSSGQYLSASDRDTMATGGIQAVELAAREQRHAHRLEVAGAHLFPREHGTHAVRVEPPLEVDVRRHRRAAQGQTGRRRRAGDAGQTVQAVEHPAVEGQPRLGVFVIPSVCVID